jgi:hypothetical protein
MYIPKLIEFIQLVNEEEDEEKDWGVGILNGVCVPILYLQLISNSTVSQQPIHTM